MSVTNLGRDERDAYEKLKQALAHAAEACVELGVRRSDGRWAKMAETFRLQQETITALAMDGQSRPRNRMWRQ